MNGRIYDPQIGRFLSADLVVQFPTNLQSYNRYSYVMNNPLRFADPSGYEIVIVEETDEEGNIHYKIAYTATLVNNSSENLSEKKLEGIKSQLINEIEETWNGSQELGSGITVSWSVDADIRIGESSSDARETDHLIELRDSENMDEARNEKTGEYGTPDGLVDTNGENIRTMQLNADTLIGFGKKELRNRTSAHELGHQMGIFGHPPESLRSDENENDTLRALWVDNIMYQGSERGTSNLFNVLTTVKAYSEGKLNPFIKSDNDESN